MRKRITLSQIARTAGVSVPTVSKVLNGRDDVAEVTRALVQDTIRDLGYESPQRRRALSHGPALVDLVIDRLTSAYSTEVMRGIVDFAGVEQVEIVISTVSSKQTRMADSTQWAQRLSAAGRRGLILVTSEIEQAQLDSFAAHGISVVLIDPLSTPQADIATVGATNWAGGRSATEHLLGLGHRRIAFLGGPHLADCNRARLHGYHSALADAGIEADPALVSSGEFSSETGVVGLCRLLAADVRPTAVFAASDSIAIGVIAEAHRRGIRIPEDLSIVGFDGTQLGEQTVPRLTSVAQPLFEMGAAALRSVLRLSRGEPIDSIHVELATRLVVRDSTAPPRP
ncbi:MAG: LacI family DNA-binding transcriptional regulator [Burkholderiaceae bacterium]|nr:LacI family DNA-binding transcriptional regulator [Microbacteriaceae bacterium]